MKLLINGEERLIETVSGTLTVAELLDFLGLTGKFVAVELNQSVVSFRIFSEQRLSEGDKLEIVTLVGGG